MTLLRKQDALNQNPTSVLIRKKHNYQSPYYRNPMSELQFCHDSNQDIISLTSLEGEEDDRVYFVKQSQVFSFRYGKVGALGNYNCVKIQGYIGMVGAVI